TRKASPTLARNGMASSFPPDTTLTQAGNMFLFCSNDKGRPWGIVSRGLWGAPAGHGDELRERVCSEKLVRAAQAFIDAELKDPIMRGIDRNDPIARNPCLRRGPLSLDYWTRL